MQQQQTDREPTFPNAKYCFGKTEYEHWTEAAKAGDGNMNSSSC